MKVRAAILIADDVDGLDAKSVYVDCYEIIDVSFLHTVVLKVVKNYPAKKFKNCFKLHFFGDSF